MRAAVAANVRQAVRLFVYWALFAFFGIGALSQSPRQYNAGAQPPLPRMLILGGIALAVVIGLRYDVGADWKNYVRIFSLGRFSDIGSALARGDPGYQLVNWAVKRAGVGIWLVNSICAAIVAWGLMRFARAQPDPWLAVVVAMPYFIVVVAMGYTRQAAALGILFAGLAVLQRGSSVVTFAAYVAVAALFHKTAVVVLPLVIFAGKRNRLLNVIAGAALSVLLYDLLLSDSVDSLVKSYIDTRYGSQGAAIRVAMNLVPAAIMLLAGNKLDFSRHEQAIWKAFSLAAIGLLIGLFVSPSSTAVDRIALYIIPLQLAVLTRVPTFFEARAAGNWLVVFYAAAIQFTWLNFAVHSQYWVPYHFYPTST